MDGLVWWGVCGGLLGNVIRLLRIANMPPEKRPLIFEDPWWWFQFVVLALLGGFFVHLYLVSNLHLNAILAVNIGASSPIIAQNFVSNVPPIAPKRKAD